MTDKIVNTTIEILGKHYPIRCPESEIKNLQQAATYLNQQMAEIQSSGKVINLERIAIISAINITYKFLQLGQETNHLENKISNRLQHLKEKVDNALGKPGQPDFIYAME